MLFVELPQELLQYLIAYIDDHDVKQFELTCTRLYNLTNEQVLWKARCARFTYWEQTPDESITNDWKSLFNKRLHIETRTTSCLEAIINLSHGRIENFEQIKSFGYDAKDCLLEHSHASPDIDDVLARRYYANAALSCIHRQRAVETWRRIANEEPVSLETAIGTFDLFVVEDPHADTEYIARRIDELATTFKQRYPEALERPERQRALLLAQFVRDQGFRGSSYEDYYHLKNSFLGFAVRHEHSTLPIISSVLYCAIASRVEIDAHPCEVSYHVYTIVVLPNDESIYLDTFRTSEIMSNESMLQQVVEMGVQSPTERVQYYLKPALTKSILLRSALNIQTSIQQGGGAVATTSTNINRNAAEFATVCAFALLGGRMNVRNLEILCRCLQEFTADIGFVEKEILPILTPNQSTFLKRFCGALRQENNTPKKPNMRSNVEDGLIRYTVGTIFQHKKYNFEGVITGWTTNCAHDSTTRDELRNESLRRGLQQPFYYALVEDSSMRYVAEENIDEVPSRDGGKLAGIAGKYFKRFDNVCGKYVSNIKEEYPDD